MWWRRVGAGRVSVWGDRVEFLGRQGLRYIEGM